MTSLPQKRRLEMETEEDRSNSVPSDMSSLERYQKQALYRQLLVYKARCEQLEQQSMSLEEYAALATRLFCAIQSTIATKVTVDKLDKELVNRFLSPSKLDHPSSSLIQQWIETVQRECAAIRSMSGIFSVSHEQEKMTRERNLILETTVIRLEQEQQTLREENKHLSEKVVRLSIPRPSLVHPEGEKESEVKETVVEAKIEPAVTQEQNLEPITVDEAALEEAQFLAKERERALHDLQQRYQSLQRDFESLKQQQQPQHLPDSILKETPFVRHLQAQLQQHQSQLQFSRQQLDQLHVDLQQCQSSRDQMLEEKQQQWQEAEQKHEQILSSMQSELNAALEAKEKALWQLQQRTAQCQSHEQTIKEKDKLYECIKQEQQGLQQEWTRLKERLALLESGSVSESSLVQSLQADESILMQEIETIGKSFEELQEQNSLLLTQLQQRDELNAKILAEKAQLQQQFQSQARDRDQLHQQQVQFKNKEQSQLQNMRRLELRDRERLQQVSQLEQQLQQLKQTLDQQSRRLHAEQSQSSEGVMKCQQVQKELQSSQSQYKQLLEKELNWQKERHRLHEELSLFKKRFQGNNTSSSNANDTSEMDALRTLVKCAACQLRFKSVMLSRCMHTFCRECIDDRLRYRQRKCPNCGDAFGEGEVKPFYL